MADKNRKRSNSGDKNEETEDQKEITRLTNDLRQANHELRGYKERYETPGGRYTELMKNYDLFVTDNQEKSMRVTTTVIIGNEPVTSVVVLSGNSVLEEDRIDSVDNAHRMINHIGATVRRLYIKDKPPPIVSPIPPTLEENLINTSIVIASMADYQRASVSMQMSALGYLMAGLTSGDMPTTVNDLATNYNNTERKPAVAAMVAHDIIMAAVQELGNNKGTKTHLQLWMQQVFSASHGVSRTFRGLFAYIGVVAGIEQGPLAVEVKAKRSQFQIRTLLKKETTLKLVTDNCHYRKNGKVIDISMEASSYLTAEDLWDLRLLTKAILEDHRDVEVGDFDLAGFVNPSSFNVTDDDFHYLNQGSRMYWQSALNSLRQMLASAGSLEQTEQLIKFCAERKDRYARLALRFATDGTTIESAPAALVDAKKDRFFIELEPERMMPPCPDNMDPLHFNNRIGGYDAVDNSLASNQGCLNVLRVRAMEFGLGDMDFLAQHFATQDNMEQDNNDDDDRNGGENNDGDDDGNDSDNSNDSEAGKLEAVVAFNPDGGGYRPNTDGIELLSSDTSSEESEEDEEEEEETTPAVAILLPTPAVAVPVPTPVTRPWDIPPPEEGEFPEEFAQYLRENAQALLEELGLGSLNFCGDGGPIKIIMKLFQMDGKNKTKYADNGCWRVFSGQFHAMKAMFDATGRFFQFFVDVILKPFLSTIGEIKHYINGTDPRTRQNLEPTITMGLRIGVAICYLMSLKGNAGMTAEEIAQKLENIQWKEVDEYMMDEAKKRPALLIVVLFLRVTQISSLQRSAPKRGDQEGFAQIMRINRLARPWYAATNKHNYVEISLDEEVTYSSDSKFGRAKAQRVGHKSASSKGPPITPDKFQEYLVGGLRQHTPGPSGGKEWSRLAEKQLRANCNNHNSIWTVKKHMLSGLGEDPRLLNLTPIEYQQHRNEREEEKREQLEEDKNDPLLTEPIEALTMRAIQIAMKLFHPTDPTDMKGQPIPLDRYVNPMNVKEDLHPDALMVFNLGERRIRTFARDYYFNGRPVGHDVDESLIGTQGGNRLAAQRQKDDHPWAPTFWNGRFLTPLNKTRGRFTTVLSLSKQQLKRNKLHSDRLTCKSWRDIEANRDGEEHMFTKLQLVQELIEMRKESGGDNKFKKWFKKYLVVGNKKLDTDAKMTKLAKSGCNKEDLAKMLAKLRIKKVPNSSKLVLLNKANQVTLISNSNVVTFDGIVVDVFNQPFINNTLAATEGDLSFDMTNTSDEAVTPAVAPARSYSEIMNRFGGFLGNGPVYE